eukprot:512067-Amphidinium_carterae.3
MAPGAQNDGLIHTMRIEMMLCTSKVATVLDEEAVMYPYIPVLRADYQASQDHCCSSFDLLLGRFWLFVVALPQLWQVGGCAAVWPTLYRLLQASLSVWRTGVDENVLPCKPGPQRDNGKELMHRKETQNEMQVQDEGNQEEGTQMHGPP